MHLPHQTVTLLDAPGHRDFISNMITGGIQADCGLLVVSAAKGEFEAGMSPAGITKDHLLILRGNGVETLGILVNKMDDQQHEKRRKPRQHDPEPPDLERRQRRQLHRLSLRLEGQIAADLRRFDLFPDAAFVLQIDIQLSLLAVRRAIADGVRLRVVVRQAQLPLLDDGLGYMRRGRMAVGDILKVFPNRFRNAGGDLAECRRCDRLRLRLQPVGVRIRTLGKEDRAAVAARRFAGQRVHTGMVFRRDGGVELNVLQAPDIPDAVLAVHRALVVAQLLQPRLQRLDLRTGGAFLQRGGSGGGRGRGLGRSRRGGRRRPRRGGGQAHGDGAAGGRAGSGHARRIGAAGGRIGGVIIAKSPR